ncbi:zinc finger protein ZAT10-like [Olea europaea var. sylvestris]|uniref:zinc finger protein ZAT10-like n=1 Tax=Olea europaea var. sylvestris TaxID=158386 RepID=UPI000C1D13B9|nr:zinc finger protein ZAT10-like [Olea europaea var. sylvestris]
MAGLQPNEFDTLCSYSSKKRNYEPTEIEEEAALALLMLSQDNQSWHTSPATSAAAIVELIEDVLNHAATAVTTTSERTAALASAGDDKKSIEPFSPTIIASSPDQNKPYICSVCGKSFSSYQALGGHKTSHRDRSQFATTTAITNTSNMISYVNPSGRIHKCNVCSENFTTGQALGGHMRMHYEGVIKGGKKTGLIKSKGGASSQCNSDGCTNTVDFNLNLAPALPETYSDFTLYSAERIQVLSDQKKAESRIPFKKQRLDE